VQRSYAVTWSEDGARPYPGKLELDATDLRFAGGSSALPDVRAAVPYGDILSLRLARHRIGPTAGRPVLRLERRSAPAIEISSVLSVGALHELARCLAAEVAHERGA
jgi:hypothetical protein